MSLSMHSASVPVFTKMLTNLQVWLDKAEVHATAKKYDTSVLLASRLAPDMLPLIRQIQIASDTAKFCVARLAGVDAPKFEDKETNFAELRERIRRTIDYVQSVPADQINGTEDKDVTVPRRDGAMVLKGAFYLEHYAMANFYFHVTTAYALLRHNGVELGKSDYLGKLQS